MARFISLSLILAAILFVGAACRSADSGQTPPEPARSRYMSLGYMSEGRPPEAEGTGETKTPTSSPTPLPVAKPDWLTMRETYESRRYSQGVADGTLIFRVDDGGKAMRWLWPFARPVDARKCPIFVLKYRAERISTEKGEAYDSVMWLRDGRPYGGFFIAVTPADIIADGKPHELRIDLRQYRPVGPLTQVCIEVRSTDNGEGILEIDGLSFVEAPRPAAISILDGKPFEAMTEWAKGGNVSADFSHAAERGMALFEIRDANAHMKWALQFDQPIDWREWPVLEFEYKATGLVDDGYEYLVWLFDGRPEHAAGFEAIIPREIRADGQVHKFYVSLARFNIAGPLVGVAVRVLSGDKGNATLMITKLEFLPAWPANAPSKTPSEGAGD